jgi:hypothetical protein
MYLIKPLMEAVVIREGGRQEDGVRSAEEGVGALRSIDSIHLASPLALCV